MNGRTTMSRSRPARAPVPVELGGGPPSPWTVALRGYPTEAIGAYMQAQQEYARLPDDEARAICAHQWVKMAAQDVQGRWLLLLRSLAVIRDQEAWRHPSRVDGRTYPDFKSYF